MNWFPVIPISTGDTLHKYVALNALWFVCAIFLLLGVMHYQNFEHLDFYKNQVRLNSAQETLRQFSARLISLDNGKINENVIPGISERYPPEAERTILQNVIPTTRDDIVSLKKLTKSPPSNLAPVLRHFYFDRVLIVVLGLGLFFAYCGFRGWIKNQRITEEIQKLDLELKRLHLKDAKRLNTRRRN